MHFLEIYFEFLLISVRAFLPSLRVLKTSQEREKIIKNKSKIREITFKLILLAIKLTLSRNYSEEYLIDIKY